MSFAWRHKLYTHLREAHANAIFGQPHQPAPTPAPVPQVAATPANAKCKICATEVPQAKMAEHMKEHLEEPPKIRPCQSCDKKFVSKLKLLLHRQQSHGEKKRKVRKCQKCPRTFDSKQLLAEHVQKRHEETPCPRCGKKFQSRSDAKTHFNDTHKRHKSTSSTVTSVTDEAPSAEERVASGSHSEPAKGKEKPPIRPVSPPPKIEKNKLKSQIRYVSPSKPPKALKNKPSSPTKVTLPFSPPKVSKKTPTVRKESTEAPARPVTPPEVVKKTPTVLKQPIEAPVRPVTPPIVEKRTPPKQPESESIEPRFEPEAADIESEEQPDDIDDVITFQDTRIFFKDENERASIERMLKNQPKVRLVRMRAFQAGSRLVITNITTSNNHNTNNAVPKEAKKPETEKLITVMPKREPGILDALVERNNLSAATSPPPPTATTTAATSGQGKRRSDSNVSSESKRSKSNSDHERPPTFATTATDVNDADSIHQFSDNEPRPHFIPNPYDLNLEATNSDQMSLDFSEADDIGDLNGLPEADICTSSFLSSSGPTATETQRNNLIGQGEGSSFKAPILRIAKNLQSKSIIDPTNISITDEVQPPPQVSASHQFFDDICQTVTERAPTPANSEKPNERPANISSSCGRQPQEQQEVQLGEPVVVQPREDSSTASLVRLSTSASKVSESTPILGRGSRSESASSGQTTSSAPPSTRQLTYKFQTLTNKLVRYFYENITFCRLGTDQ